MAKKKRVSADNVRKKRQDPSKKLNPFEVKINRQKHQILGRKLSKHDCGFPGLSRSKALKKRRETLLKEYKQELKSNKFVDKRFGENDASMTLEDKMLKRYTLEKQKQQSENKNIFNLNEDEELTHYGQSLSEIEKFENPVDSDENDNEDEGRISGRLIDEHFGGFLMKRSDSEGRKGWKERMQELISISKQLKHDRQTEREQTFELTEKVDADWKNLRLLVGANAKKRDDGKDDTRPAVDGYDKMIRQLKFEIKGKPTDRLKSEEEIAKEEKERLEKLEADRLRRMRGEEEELQTISSHFSADALGDEEFLLPVRGRHSKEAWKEKRVTFDVDIEEEKSDDPEEEKSKESDQEDDEETEDEVDDSGNNSDGENSDTEEKDEREERKEEDEEQEESEQEKLKEQREAASKELPYAFEAPRVYGDLVSLLAHRSEDEQVTIIERLLKHYHPSLAELNKKTLQKLFEFLLRYILATALRRPPLLTLSDRLIPSLYRIGQHFSTPAAHILLQEIVVREREFSQICERRGGRGYYPLLDTLLLFKLVTLMFPTSDFQHPVTTPAMLFMGDVLGQCLVTTETDVAAGLFLCTLFSQCVSLSKRYVPQAINFLHGTLFLASIKDPKKVYEVFPPFTPVGRSCSLLLVSSDSSKNVDLKPLKLSQIFSPCAKNSCDEFRINAVNCAIELLSEFSSLYTKLPSYSEIFSSVVDICEKLPLKRYPMDLQTKIRTLVGEISTGSTQPRQALVIQDSRKPKLLKVFEPRIEEITDERRKRRVGSTRSNEQQRLVHKYKRELKGAKREIKKDAQFLARQQLQEQLERDEERKRKVKQLYGSLGMQEGEYQALKRKKQRSSWK